eukprot:3887679-Rhodomonas_salina.4
MRISPVPTHRMRQMQYQPPCIIFGHFVLTRGITVPESKSMYETDLSLDKVWPSFVPTLLFLGSVLYY